ncbi:hypothetical protein K7G92_001898 [Pasteurella canis]|uniref:hypothetical protein n=1 Tax=Pasteurella canis TaxID=753 RepID=UPI001E5F6B8B|nr:hypothetical protein [Pasteurella canis]UEA16619.1 hypothetical protein K7G92_001898 [Pasteurella canis]
MARLPTFEKILHKTYQAFVSSDKQLPTSIKNRFINHELRPNNHVKITIELQQFIFKSLNVDTIDKYANCALTKNLSDLARSYTILSNQVYTFNSSEKKIIWHLLGYFFIPWIARIAAFWNLDGPIDTGMTRGCFWYLPHNQNPKNKNEVYLPMAQVLDWFLDITGMTTKEFSEYYLKKFNNRNIDHTSIIRQFNKWRKGEVPQVFTIQEYFRNDLLLEFKGSIELDNQLPLDRQVELVLNFLKKKNLTDEQIHAELAIPKINIFSSVTEKENFIKKVCERYKKPTNQSIQRRFLIARAIQDSYIKLHKYFTPQVSPLCPNLKENKLLQLVLIYENIYNLTIKARVEASSDSESLSEITENKYFYQELNKNPLLHTLSTAILPNQNPENNIKHLLNYYFENTQNELIDLVPSDEISFFSIFKHQILYYYEKLLIEIILYKKEYLEKELSLIKDFRFLQYQYHLKKNLEDKKSILKKLEKCINIDEEKIKFSLLKLDFILNTKKQKSKNDENEVTQLLELVKNNSQYKKWDAIILQYEAKHFLYKNNINKSIESFKLALEATRRNNFAGLQAEISHNLLSILINQYGINKKVQEKYYKIALNGMFYEYMGKLDSINKLYKHIPFQMYAKHCQEFFKKALYKPYPV